MPLHGRRDGDSLIIATLRGKHVRIEKAVIAASPAELLAEYSSAQVPRR